MIFKGVCDMKENLKINDFAASLCEEADKLRLNNHVKPAVQRYLTSILIKRDNPQAYKGLSLTYKKLKNYEKAIDCLLKAKESAQFDSAIYYELGLNYLLNAQVAEASKNLRRSIKLNNKNYNAQIQLAISHEMMDEPQMALAIYQKIIEEKPSFIPAYNHKAGLYMACDDFLNALHVFKKITEIKPKYYRAYLGMAICLDKSGYLSKALVNYKKYLSQAPKNKNVESIKKRVEILDKALTRKRITLKLVK